MGTEGKSPAGLLQYRSAAPGAGKYLAMTVITKGTSFSKVYITALGPASNVYAALMLPKCALMTVQMRMMALLMSFM